MASVSNHQMQNQSKSITYFCIFSFAWHRLHVYSRLEPVACFSRAWHRSRTCFPALGTGSMFSRAWHRFDVFPRLAPVPCFPALDTSCMFSRAWHWLHVFPRLAPVACFPVVCFPVLGIGFMFESGIAVEPRIAPSYSQSPGRITIYKYLEMISSPQRREPTTNSSTCNAE